jgi:predicted nucleotidyltransferase
MVRLSDTEALIEKVTSTIVDAAHPRKVILFGSFARGEQTENSDLDFLVIQESNLPRPLRAREIRRRLRGLKFPVDVLVYTPEEVREWENVPSSFVHAVMTEGRVVYG